MNSSTEVVTDRIAPSHASPSQQSPLKIHEAESADARPLNQLTFSFAPEGAPIELSREPVDDLEHRIGFRYAVKDLMDQAQETKQAEIISPQNSNLAVRDARDAAIWSLMGAEHLDPQHYAAALDTLRELVTGSTDRGMLRATNSVTGPSNGSRPESYVFSSGASDQAAELYRSLLSCGVYNPPFDPNNGANINLRWSDLHSIRTGIIDRLRQDDVLAILPFVAEKRTAHKNVSYALDVMRPDAVIAVSAVKDIESESKVQNAILGTEATLVRQEEILKCFDWHQIGRVCQIPIEYERGEPLPPLGGKGLTMLAGIAWAQSQNRLSDKMVFFSDTDFIAPWEYDSLTHLGIPLAAADGFEPRLIKTAKTGAGRNNEAWTREANMIATDLRQPELARGMALVCQQIIWPLCGNMAMRGDDLSRMPFATGPGIETQIVAYYAGRQLQYGRCEVAQVCNPNRLTEDGESRPVRESAMIGRCQLWLRSLLESCGDMNQPLHEWQVGEIARFNANHGGRHLWGAYQSPFHGAQTGIKITLDHMLPSLEQCDAIGAIDWDRMLSLKDR